MPDIQSHTLSAGDIINVSNQGEKAIKVKIVTADGAIIESNLHPGASCRIIAGNKQLDIFILDAEQIYNNFEIV